MDAKFRLPMLYANICLPLPPPKKEGGGGVVNYAEIPRPYAHELVEGESQMRHFFPPLQQLFCLNIKLCSFVKSKVENVNVTYNSALLLISERKIEQSPECLTRFHPVVCFPLLLRFEVLSISCLHTIRL